MDEKIMHFFDIIRDSIVDAEENEKPMPLNPGEEHAYRCFMDSEVKESSVDDRRVFECAELPELAHEEEFFEMLLDAGIGKIAVTTSEGLLPFLHRADELRWQIRGVCSVAHHTDPNEPPTIVQGIAMYLT